MKFIKWWWVKKDAADRRFFIEVSLLWMLALSLLMGAFTGGKDGIGWAIVVWFVIFILTAVAKGVWALVTNFRSQYAEFQNEVFDKLKKDYNK